MLVGCRNWCTFAGMCLTGSVWREFWAASDPVPKEFSSCCNWRCAVCLAFCFCCPNSGSGPLALRCSQSQGEGQAQLCGLIVVAVQVPSTPFSSQMLFTALSRLACPLAVREPGCPACGCGESRAERVTPSSSREQGSFRQSLGKHSKSRPWFPGYLVVQFWSLGH